MTSQEAIAKIEAYLDGYHVPADRAEALRLAVGALAKQARRDEAMPWRCQRCSLLDVSCFGSNEDCNGFEERKHE